MEATAYIAQDKADWVEFVTQYNDIFNADHCGYWLRGVDRTEEGVLAWEDDEQHPHFGEPGLKLARFIYRTGGTLPPGWFRLDKALAEKAWDIGVQKHGEQWYSEGDSTTYDTVLQLALLDEVRYG